MSGYTGYVPITRVNVSQQLAPLPSTRQRTGAIVSQGSTTLAMGSYSLLTSLSSLTPLLLGKMAITSLAWATGMVTMTVPAENYTIGETLEITVLGSTATLVPGGYNGTFLATVVSATTLTYPLATNPGTATTMGFYTLEDVSETTEAVTTYFDAPGAPSVYVLELGAGNAAEGVIALMAFITETPGLFYSYLLPHPWGVEPTFFTFANNYTAPTAKVYFHLTTTLAYWQANPLVFSPLLKDVITTIEAPVVAASWMAGTPYEFSAAAGFAVTLTLNPSPTNQVTQAAYSYLYGVTPYPTFGNTSLLASLALANINIVGTGAEGGLTNAVWMFGTTLDGMDFNKYWYSVDNVQINLDLYTSAAVINGSNNPQAPLNYNQQGINSLQGVAGSVMRSEIAYSLALGTLLLTQMTGTEFAAAVEAGAFAGYVVVNSVPFMSYVQINPSDYPARLYQGMSVAYTVQNGFRNIVYNVTVANFVA
jgi:hypothetical protein